ncbi:MAG: hemolysin III family protein [Oscillospiraceae bacterium]|nr:hemolysin III family protein [Oscillospiraceae bacterium]
MFLTLFWIKAPRWLTTGIYLGMGWLVLIMIWPLIVTFRDLNALYTLWWLVAGGVFYTIGAVIYGFKWPKLKNKHFSHHEIFHIFVLLGSACQFWFIFRYVIYM